MKKKVIKEARRLMKKEIGAKVDETFLNSIFDEEDGFYYHGYFDALAEAEVISGEMALNLIAAMYEARNYKEPEPEKSFVVVWKHRDAKGEEVFNWERDKYAAWRMAKDFDKKFDLEYIYVEEVEECNLESGWTF